MDRDQEDARDLIASLVRDTGWSVTEIARRAGVAPSTLTRIYPTPSVKYTLSTRTLTKLRQLQPAPAAMAPAAVREERSAYSARPADDSLPLYRLAPAYPPPSGAPDTLEWLAGDLHQPIDQVPWSIASGSDDRYFLTYMPDDTMAPRFRSGDYLLVDRVKPAASGSEVLVVLGEPAGERVFCCIAQLVDRNRSQIRLRQYAESGAETLSRRDVAQIYAIVGSFDETLRR